MKKSLIALTLAALPVAAMADVTLYGTIKAGVEVSRVKDKGGNSKTATQIADFGSKIGFKGQ
ncbi:porin, partial [Klebsiella pneumoniae]|nr:porin [Klebsiella pneumoniae]